MTTLNESNHRGEFLVGELPSGLSRTTGTLITGQDLAAGTVLGKITASGKYTQHAPAESDGSENADAILFDNVDASDADAEGVVLIDHDAAVNTDEVVFADAGAGKTAAIADLEAKGFSFR